MDASPNVDYSKPVDLFSQQARNRRRSAWLIAGFILFFAWLGFGGDYILYLSTQGGEPEEYKHVIPWLGIVLTLVGAGMAIHAWRSGASDVLKSTGARQIFTPKGEVEQQYVNVVEEMAIASGITCPGIWIVDDPDPNAFATGRDPENAHIAVTEGLLLSIDRSELQAVVAHEMGHIKNLDVRLMTLLAALVGTIVLLSDVLWRVVFRSGMKAGGRSRKKDNNPLIIVLLVVWLISWLLAPIIVRLIALSLSREREYLADAMSAQFTRNPLALASALEKIEHAAEPTRQIKRGTAHLCIADPLGRRINEKETWLAARFATHPPMAIRVARLKAMGYRSLKATG
ncbi:MAG TPA: M48 family metallopeptidase [Gemmatimonadaceae bacterium]|nr:M48 family metallopeptidase [Gemmatimonadaceae bacterium]